MGHVAFVFAVQNVVPGPSQDSLWRTKPVGPVVARLETRQLLLASSTPALGVSQMNWTI